MQNHDLVQFTAMLVAIGEIYGKPISEILTDIYWQSLKKFSLQDLKRAFEAHIHNPDGGQFFPKPADVVRFIEGSGETKSLQAWGKVYKAITQVGVYQSIVFDDPLIHAVLDDMGGWVKLCSTLLNELPARAAEFQKRYMIFLDHPPNRYPKYCCGLMENINNNSDFKNKPQLLFIGDLEKAKQVFFKGSNLSILVHAEDTIKNLEK